MARGGRGMCVWRGSGGRAPACGGEARAPVDAAAARARRQQRTRAARDNSQTIRCITFCNDSEGVYERESVCVC
jgi:hypothetical protein